DFETAEFQLLYSRPLDDFYDVQAGFRFDAEPDPRRGYAVFGIQGLAEQFIELDAAAFVSNEGELSARLEAEHDLLLTQRLVLQPAAEVNLSAHSVEEREIGAGITDIGLGARLRYEVQREIAPYLGVQWERKLGETASIARKHGEDPAALSFVAGMRVWF
ncbi:MAG: copper resistance protein B, partial [Alphaproteobacteria bacterium]